MHTSRCVCCVCDCVWPPSSPSGGALPWRSAVILVAACVGPPGHLQEAPSPGTGGPCQKHRYHTLHIDTHTHTHVHASAHTHTHTHAPMHTHLHCICSEDISSSSIENRVSPALKSALAVAATAAAAAGAHFATVGRGYLRGEMVVQFLFMPYLVAGHSGLCVCLRACGGTCMEDRVPVPLVYTTLLLPPKNACARLCAWVRARAWQVWLLLQRLRGRTSPWGYLGEGWAISIRMQQGTT